MKEIDKLKAENDKLKKKIKKLSNEHSSGLVPFEEPLKHGEDLAKSWYTAAVWHSNKCWEWIRSYRDLQTKIEGLEKELFEIRGVK